MSMLVVQSSTEELPGLEELIERRRALGLDTFDEWWEGVYRVVGGPSPEHGTLVVRLGALLLERCDPLGLWVSAPMNVGVDKWDAKVPDIAVIHHDAERTSPAYMATAELVVEIMSPREIRGETYVLEQAIEAEALQNGVDLKAKGFSAQTLATMLNDAMEGMKARITDPKAHLERGKLYLKVIGAVLSP